MCKTCGCGLSNKKDPQYGKGISPTLDKQLRDYKKSKQSSKKTTKKGK